MRVWMISPTEREKIFVAMVLLKETKSATLASLSTIHVAQPRANLLLAATVPTPMRAAPTAKLRV